MSSFRHLYQHFVRYGTKHKSLYLFCLMILFWTIFDGIISFITPLIITGEGLSKTLMGIILGSSSVAGALLDVILSRYLSNTHFRRLFLMMFGVCFVYPFILWQAKTFWLYLVAMAIWGFYYDLKTFGTFDFVGRFTDQPEHVSSFGVLSVFGSLGYLLAPLLVGAWVEENVGFNSFSLALTFLAFSFLCFLVLLKATAQQKEFIQVTPLKLQKKESFGHELNLWRKIGKILAPVLILTFFLNFLDAFFWTIGPIFSESFGEGQVFAQAFLSVYTLPSLLVGWEVGSLTARWGKKKTAFISFLAGSLVLSLIALTSAPVLILIVTFAASFLISFSGPAIDGAYADYIAESPRVEKEIEGLQDFFANLGYVIGPMLAGLAADLFGNAPSFSMLGLIGVLVALILLKITPAEIKVRVS